MKKLLFLALLAGGAWWYASRHFDFHDTLAYAKSHPSAVWAQPAVYSVGLVYYGRADYPKAQEAFTQLLTDYPTGQYTAHALMRLSEVADENRDYATEKQALDRFLQDFPDDPNREIAQKRRDLLYNK